MLVLSAAALALPAVPGFGQTIDWPHCSPNNDLDLDPGGSITCSSGPGVSLPFFDVVLENVDGDLVEVQTDTPLVNITATITSGAVIDASGSDPDGLFAPQNGATLVNDGTINASGAGLSALASGVSATNNGAITATGDPEGSEGIGIEGAGASVSNTFTGSITVDGDFGEGIGVEGTNGSIVNAGDIAIGGTAVGGIGIEGNMATISNQAGGNITLVDSDQSVAISTDGSGGDITNAGNVLMNGVGNIGIGGFGTGQAILNTGNVFANGSPASLGIGVAGAGGSVTLGSGSRIETASGSINVVLAGSAALGTGSLANFGIGSGATFSSAGDAELVVGENSVGLLIAHNGTTLPSTPTITSSAFGAVGAALYGADVNVDVTAFASLTGPNSTLVGIGDKGAAAPGFLVTGGTASNATISFSQTVALSGAGSTILEAAGDDHTINVLTGADLSTPLSGTVIRVTGDRADIDVETLSTISGGGIAVAGDDSTITHRGDLRDKGIAVQTGEMGRGTIENLGIIDLGTEPDGTGIKLDAGAGASTIIVGTSSEPGSLTGGEAAFGVDGSTVGGAITLSVGADSEISTAAGAVARLRGTQGPPGLGSVTVDARGLLTGNSGISVIGAETSVTTTELLTIEENERWLEGTTDTGLAVESEAAVASWTADAGISVVSNVAVESEDRFAISLTGPGGNRGSSISVDYTVIGTPARLAVEGARLSGINLEGDRVNGDILLEAFTVDATGTGTTYGISGNILNNWDLRVGSLAVPMSWAVLGTGPAVGYRVNAASGDPLMKVVNAGDLGVSSSVQAVGMLIEASASLTVPSDGACQPVTGSPAIRCPVVIPMRRELSNEGGLIELLGGSAAAGLLVRNGANAVRAENGGTIRTVGPSPGARGIAFDGVSGGFAINAGIIEISDGPSARGIEVNGSNSVVFNGNADAAIIPLRGNILSDLGSYPGTFLALSAAFDFSTDDTDSFPLPGIISVNGSGAIGIDVMGNNNIVATTFGNADPPIIAPVTATGTDAIGVRLGGNGNSYFNSGRVSGSAFSVLGGSGDELVVNAGIFVTGVSLGDGDDIYLFGAGAEQAAVDGGSEITADTLYTIAGSEAGSADDAIGVDFTEFFDFEIFEKSGPERLIVNGILDVPQSNIRQGALEVAASAVITGDVFCGFDTGIAGEGLVQGGIIGIGCDVELGASEQAEPKQTVADTAQLPTGEAGAPGGMLQVDGDVALQGGTVRVDIGSAALFDRLLAGGDLDLDGTVIEVRFVNGYLPAPEDTFEILQADGAISGTETVTFRFVGAVGAASFVDLGNGAFGIAFDVKAPPAGPDGRIFSDGFEA